MKIDDIALQMFHLAVPIKQFILRIFAPNVQISCFQTGWAF